MGHLLPMHCNVSYILARLLVSYRDNGNWPLIQTWLFLAGLVRLGQYWFGRLHRKKVKNCLRNPVNKGHGLSRGVNNRKRLITEKEKADLKILFKIPYGENV